MKDTRKKKRVKTTNTDNAPADKVSTMVEKYTAAKGDPWKRNLGKQKEEEKAQEGAAQKKKEESGKDDEFTPVGK